MAEFNKASAHSVSHKTKLYIGRFIVSLKPCDVYMPKWSISLSISYCFSCLVMNIYSSSMLLLESVNHTNLHMENPIYRLQMSAFYIGQSLLKKLRDCPRLWGWFTKEEESFPWFKNLVSIGNGDCGGGNRLTILHFAVSTTRKGETSPSIMTKFMYA